MNEGKTVEDYLLAAEKNEKSGNWSDYWWAIYCAIDCLAESDSLNDKYEALALYREMHDDCKYKQSSRELIINGFAKIGDFAQAISIENQYRDRMEEKARKQSEENEKMYRSRMNFLKKCGLLP